MKLRPHRFPMNTIPSAALRWVSGRSRQASAIPLKITDFGQRAESGCEDFRAKLLDRRWALRAPDAQIHRIVLSSKHAGNVNAPDKQAPCVNDTNPSLGDGIAENESRVPSFYVVRDDLIHPLVNGNKARKLDALLPFLEDNFVTDVVTCGGCQSAHTAAVAVSCVERGIRSHLLLRGEQPDVLTGYNLISTLYGNVTYAPRSLYSNREEMLTRHAGLVAGSRGSVASLSDMLEAPTIGQKGVRKVAVVNEGAGDSLALLGMIRLLCKLSEDCLFGKENAVKLVVDAGTGTTAVGLGIGVSCLGLPWEVTAVMLADSLDQYKDREQKLIAEFRRHFCFDIKYCSSRLDRGVVNWVERRQPRKFGNVIKGELEVCQWIAQQTGILVDPIYTLAAWELSTSLAEKEGVVGGSKVIMLHTGGTLGMFGLAQRYKSDFRTLKDEAND